MSHPAVEPDPELEALLDRVPALQGPRTVSELSGGLTNRNYRVTVEGAGDYVVRRFPPRANRIEERLGIDRDAEHRNSVAAAQSGAGAEVVDYLPALGVLVVGYVDGVTLDNASFDDPAVVARVGAAVRQLHEGPAFTGRFDMFARQRAYLAVVREEGGPFDGYDDHEAAFGRVERALAVRPAPLVPCNNDLLAANFVDGGDRVRIIDYEYSGGNDACFELGNTSTECELDAGRTEALLAAYDGVVTRERLARVRLQALVSAYGWALWGLIQHRASDIDANFHDWGLERFEKAASGFTSAGFETLLREVASG
jgi:thiamine kinase-like enzyme